ncbi:oxidoreductase [filamentous cyanobacterium CCP2]|nr:oxidoreductase [filamentous cyanobacterium CCP2]
MLRNFLALPQVEMIAVVDPNGERLKQLPAQFGLANNALLTTDWNEALSLGEVDAVVIATPAITHYALIRSALERGCHVLAEKPLTLDVTEAIELCQLAAQHQRQLVVDHTYLFHPAVQRGRAAIQQGQVGKPRYGYAARTHLGPVRQDVDALWDLAIHDIAIFNYWLNQTPIAVHANGTAWLQQEFSSPNPAPLHSDLVWVTLTYPDGFQAFIHLCWSNPDKQRRLSLVGSEGTLVFDELAPVPLTVMKGRFDRQLSDHQQPHFIPMTQPPEALQFEPLEPLQQVCLHFLACIQQNEPSWISSGWLGAELVQTLSTLTRSLQGSEV